jgi:hypothetical protein
MNRDTALLLFSALAGLAACTSQTTDNFTNPPSGPPSTCAPITAFAACGAGGVSYSCSSDRPDDGDSDLVCDQGTPGAGGTTSYCCAAYGQWASECAPAVVPGCGARSFGFACRGVTSPDEADPDLVCSAPLSEPDGGGEKEYCCVLFDPSPSVCQCASFDDSALLCGVHATETGCPGATVGFNCAPGHSPSEVNPLLACPAPGVDGGAGTPDAGTGPSEGSVAGPDGGLAGASYCCSTP